ncbi:uncharacterized protein LOC128216991 isoform X2 [Mya arenaria]|uniref:uncharacterized protein LOC128216991 isoform X2 n=1 Tax=Mya arenaria TaxID=6604 RepID=UPI0022E28625|nr:uncharacterized protein LOC128216991 isoform X2 [Mya arenaria]
MTSRSARPSSRGNTGTRPGSRQSSRTSVEMTLVEAGNGKGDVSVKSSDISDNTVSEKLDEIYTNGKESSGTIKPLWYPEQNQTSTRAEIHPLPGGGLARESTMVGVYSNLTAHSRQQTGMRVPQKSTLSIAGSGPEMKLLQAVAQGDGAVVRRLVYDNPTMNLHVVDRNKRTVLHHCLEARPLSLEVLHFLLKKAPPLDVLDTSDQTPLHIAVKNDDVMCTYLLLKYGADANVQAKRTGRTALHEATSRSHVRVTEVLLCHGANPGFKDKEGRTPGDVCKSNFPRTQYDAMVIQADEKRMAIHDIRPDEGMQSSKIGLSIEAKDENLHNKTWICKRQSLEEFNGKFPIEQIDDVISDVYTCRFLESTVGGLFSVTLRLFDSGVTSREEVRVLTSGDKVIVDVSQESTDKLSITFECEMTDDISLVAVCRPKIERFEVGKTAATMTSSLDDRVHITVGEGAFGGKSTVSLQVLEMSEEEDISAELILASTPFYFINADHRTKKRLEVELPVPVVSDGTEKLVVLKKTGDTWSPVHKQLGDPDVHSVKCAPEGLPACLVVAVTRSTDGEENHDSVAMEIQEAYRSAVDPAVVVCFLCMSRRVGTYCRFSVVLECCTIKTRDQRMRYWTAEGYSEHTGDTKDEEKMFVMKVRSTQAFTIIFHDNPIARKDPRTFCLEFHTKRQNVIQFDVELKGKSVQYMNGRLYIYDKNTDADRDKPIGDNPLTHFEINLVLNHVEAELSNVIQRSTDSSRASKSLTSDTSQPSTRSASAKYKSKTPIDGLSRLQATLNRAMNNIDPIETTPEPLPPVDSETVADPDYKFLNNNENAVFLDDELLDWLVSNFGVTWYKALVLMGVPFSEIEDALTSSSNISVTKRQLIRKWRDGTQSRADVGVPLLLGALFKGGHRSLATNVQLNLRNWYGEHNEGDHPLYDWLTNAYQNSDLFVPSDYPKPMSDQYLVLMSDELPLSRDLTRVLSLPDKESDDVINAEFLLHDGIRLMKVMRH